jgi:hypothetical protein
LSAWGQRRERNVVQSGGFTRGGAVLDNYKPLSRNAIRALGKARALAAGVPQAGGVLQINQADAHRTAWFVTTDVIPKGSTLIAYIAPDGVNFLKLGPLTATEDILPGKSFLLPEITDFGIFWPTGITTYDVVVNVNGQDTHCAADFAVGGARNYDDLAVVVPLIYQWSEDIQGRSVTLTIQGEFTGDPMKIVLEDLVVPQSAITQNGGTVKVNLSQVPGMRLDLYQDFLLTVAQAGYSDTRIFTHSPFNPNNYDPAPAIGSAGPAQ